ncbi:MAG: hypothetical protein K2X90_03175 [Candidatus Babeliaceae bacterium]|nr:hypothetical protein [Candidatus Babeliaceae bacterium]
MKIINQLLLILAAAFFDLSVNGLVGRLVSVTTPLLFAYHVSFFSPKITIIVSAFFVTMQALLYGVTTPIFYGMLLFMMGSARFLNTVLRQDIWVRLSAATFYFLLLLIFLPLTFSA